MMQQKHRADVEELLLQFIVACRAQGDDLGYAIQSVMAQFLTSIKLQFFDLQDSDTIISHQKLLEVEIEALRSCIIDLEKCKNMSINGEILQ